MTQEIFNQTWQDNVVALAAANGTEISMGANDSYTMTVYTLSGGASAPAIRDNSNFTFAVETTPASTTSNLEVGANTGVITTTGATAGTAVISVSLTGHENVPPAFATVTVTA